MGKEYRTAGAIKTEGVTGAGAYVLAEWRDGNNNLIRADKLKAVTGTTAWQEYAAVLTMPAASEKLQIKLVTELGSGAACFDDVKVTLVAP